MTDREVMKMALAKLEHLWEIGIDAEYKVELLPEIEALRQALAQPEQEPVCDKDPFYCWSIRCQLGKVCKNTAPPKREWVGLTDEDGENICMQGVLNDWHYDKVIDAVESRLKEKNGG